MGIWHTSHIIIQLTVSVGEAQKLSNKDVAGQVLQIAIHLQSISLSSPNSSSHCYLQIIFASKIKMITAVVNKCNLHTYVFKIFIIENSHLETRKKKNNTLYHKENRLTCVHIFLTWFYTQYFNTTSILLV